MLSGSSPTADTPPRGRSHYEKCSSSGRHDLRWLPHSYPCVQRRVGQYASGGLVRTRVGPLAREYRTGAIRAGGRVGPDHSLPSRARDLSPRAAASATRGERAGRSLGGSGGRAGVPADPGAGEGQKGNEGKRLDISFPRPVRVEPARKVCRPPKIQEPRSVECGKAKSGGYHRQIRPDLPYPEPERTATRWLRRR